MPERTSAKRTPAPAPKLGDGTGGFHLGQVGVQRRLGVEEPARRVARSIQSTIPPVAAHFLAAQRMALLGWKDAQDRVWASMFLGEAGFLRAGGERVLYVDTAPVPGDPIGELPDGSPIGLLAIELETRRRMVVGGSLSRTPSGWMLEADRVYSQCPKYIQARGPAGWGRAPSKTVPPRVSVGLDADQREWVGQANVFFLASHHPIQGSGVSHRGGEPGFVHVHDERRLEFPDYPGNKMFLTLGNIASNPRAGLLFVDFNRRRLLQITGSALLRWDEAIVKRHPGAQLAVQFQIEATRELSY